MTTHQSMPYHTHNEMLIEYLEEALSRNNDPFVRKKLKRCLDKVAGLEYYLENVSPPETELQKKLYADTLTEPWEEHGHNGTCMFTYCWEMLSTRHSTQFLKSITEIGKIERVLEIGMFTGYSAAIFCDSKFVKEVVTLEIDPFLCNFVKTRFDGTTEGKKLRIIEGPALESLPKLKENGETFDLVFIDADKINYINYYNYIMDNNLIGPNGLIILDNTLWKGELFPEPESDRGKLFREINEYIRNDERVIQVILQIGDGTSLVRRK